TGYNLGIGTTAPGNKLSISGGVGIGTTAPGSLFLSTAAPDGGMIIEGNVGIGTTSPVAALAIGSGQIAMPNGTASAPSYSFGAELGSGMYRVGTNTLGFATTGTQRVTIDANGTLNTSDIVAVRNSAEDIKIITLQNNSGDVAAGLNIDFRLRQNFGSYVILDSAYVDVGHEQDWISAGTTNSYLRFGTILAGVLGEKMRITSGGNVGIGTTAPGYKLEVYTGSASGWVVTADGTWRTDGIGSRPGNGAQSGDVQHERGIKLRSGAYGIHRSRC
ncbi:MAG: Cell wall surface anchor family protein, partial [Candidatus Moranbacteria bacterium GW2011_GWC2_40_12]